MVEILKLIAFDLDGLLVDGGDSWMQVHPAPGSENAAEKNEQRYPNGEITLIEDILRSL